MNLGTGPWSQTQKELQMEIMKIMGQTKRKSSRSPKINQILYKAVHECQGL